MYNVVLKIMFTGKKEGYLHIKQEFIVSTKEILAA